MDEGAGERAPSCRGRHVSPLYRLKKTLLGLDRDVLANVWEGTWEDRDSGILMAGRGLEVWRMRDGMIAVWDAAFNVWPQDGPRVSPVMGVSESTEP